MSGMSLRHTMPVIALTGHHRAMAESVLAAGVVATHWIRQQVSGNSGKEGQNEHEAEQASLARQPAFHGSILSRALAEVKAGTMRQRATELNS